MLTRGFIISGKIENKIEYEQAKNKIYHIIKLFIKEQKLPQNTKINIKEWIFAGEIKQKIWIVYKLHI